MTVTRPATATERCAEYYALASLVERIESNVRPLLTEHRDTTPRETETVLGDVSDSLTQLRERILNLADMEREA